MTTRADSYSSTGEVRAYTRHLLGGQTTFNSTTLPTVTEVEKFIDRASGVLNFALAGVGFATPISNSTAKLSCDDWVTARAAEYVELTQRGVGFSDAEGSRTTVFHSLSRSASEFAKDARLGFLALGVPVSGSLSRGLKFTGLDAQSQRADPADSTLEQPVFKRRLFDEPQMTDFTDRVEDE